ncbi:hypothetical protein [Holospora curviuscula]|uniref:Uncharacterized protein n=1 Tax=Holospora curviuscula TaxID=1082868 RepID=A0A2S5R9J5_9PROT|nr:hypothetical protein [Holospora curviuscula]PPE03988.1 hypothetical protein HCUR_00523 [Holospora curviuscula]
MLIFEPYQIAYECILDHEEIKELIHFKHFSRGREIFLQKAKEFKLQMTTVIPQDQQCSVTSSKKDPSKAQFEE